MSGLTYFSLESAFQDWYAAGKKNIVSIEVEKNK